MLPLLRLNGDTLSARPGENLACAPAYNSKQGRRSPSLSFEDLKEQRWWGSFRLPPVHAAVSYEIMASNERASRRVGRAIKQQQQQLSPSRVGGRCVIISAALSSSVLLAPLTFRCIGSAGRSCCVWADEDERISNSSNINRFWHRVDF